MNSGFKRLAAVVVLLTATNVTRAALLAYEPFTNATGAAIIGSSNGFGFNGAWQSNSSSGTATNIGFGLSYTDSGGRVLQTSGGAGFFQGPPTTASSAMQPIRLFNFSRGTNGTDGVTTWISFLVFRTGPTGTLAGNPYGRGANLPHDINTGAIQKLAIGNGSGAGSNTVALIPQGSGALIKGATNIFGGVTNFVVVRIDHVTGAANDSAHLFVNPALDSAPSISSAGAAYTNAYDFSFDRLRIFAGGSNNTGQLYVEMIVDEYRIGETFADVAPIVLTNPPPVAWGPLVITNVTRQASSIVLSGTGGSNSLSYYVLATTNITSPLTNWLSIATNLFYTNGNFDSTNPFSTADAQWYYRLMVGGQIVALPVAPSITNQPQSQSVAVGSNATFTVGAGGTSPLFYQWYFNTNSPITGATSTTLTLNNAQTTNAGGYSVIVTNSTGAATSVVATLTVLVPPAITAPPTNLTVTMGQNATFTVLATGDAPLKYQWYFNTNTVLANATNASLTLTNAQGTNAGGYSVRVTNSVGSVTSVIASLTVNIPPAITAQPTNLSLTVSQPATFSVIATGTAPLRYQWYFNTNTPLLNATNSAFNLAGVQAADAGGYSVRVTNIVGSVTSIVANLAVSQSPLITVQPAAQGVIVSNNTAFTVTAIGEPPLKYQWYFNTNTALVNATNASLTFTNTQTNQAGGYSVIVTNSFGAATSSVVTLTVYPPLVVGAYFVSVTNGNDSNAGTLASPFKTISKGLSVTTSGGVVYVRAGLYALSSKLILSGTSASAANTIRLWGYPGEFPVIDSTGNSSDGVGISGKFYHLKGLTVMLAGHNGINISGHSNIVEFCVTHDNGNTGLHITGGTSGTTFPSYNLILNCDSYLNYDPPIGGNADGFSAKWDMGPGNVFRGCRGWWNSDDGWDFWMANAPLVIDGCWAFYNGTNYWNDPAFNGNGQGFKLGGNYIGTPHRLVRSVTFRNESNGVDQNNNEEGQTIDNNTGWANKARNFNLNHGTNSTPHIVRNNVSFAGTSGDSWRSGTVFTSNSWQVVTSPAVSASDVQSVDESIAMSPRLPDGSLPAWPFLRPVIGGRLVDRGTNVGDPFNGSAPDLGAFETP